MDINFEYNNVKASQRLEQSTTEKLNALSERYSFMVDADVYFKKENTSTDETGMICGMRINIPKDRLFAETSSSSFDKAIAETMTEVKRQLQKKKDKMQTH